MNDTLSAEATATTEPTKAPVAERRQIALDAFGAADPTTADPTTIAATFADVPNGAALLDQAMGAAVATAASADPASIPALLTLHGAVAAALVDLSAKAPRAARTADPAAIRAADVTAAARINYVMGAVQDMLTELGTKWAAAMEALGTFTTDDEATFGTFQADERLAERVESIGARVTKLAEGGARVAGATADQVRTEFVAGGTYVHTDRDGTVHEMTFDGDSFTYNGADYASASAAAKAAAGHQANGLLYWQSAA